MSTRRSKAHYRGCLLGGAVGDALGAAPEFVSLAQIRRRIGPAGQLLAGGHRDVEADGIDQFDRPHRHAEGEHGFINRFWRNALVDRAHRSQHVGRKDGVDQESRRAFHR